MMNMMMIVMVQFVAGIVSNEEDPISVTDSITTGDKDEIPINTHNFKSVTSARNIAAGVDCGDTAGAAKTCVTNYDCLVTANDAICGANAAAGTCSCKQVALSGKCFPSTATQALNCVSGTQCKSGTIPAVCTTAAAGCTCVADQSKGIAKGLGCGNPTGAAQACASTYDCLTWAATDTTAGVSAKGTACADSSALDACKCQQIAKEGHCKVKGTATIYNCVTGSKCWDETKGAACTAASGECECEASSSSMANISFISILLVIARIM